MHATNRCTNVQITCTNVRRTNFSQNQTEEQKLTKKTKNFPGMAESITFLGISVFGKKIHACNR